MAENKNKLEELNDEQLDNVAGGKGLGLVDDPNEVDETLKPSL